MRNCRIITESYKWAYNPASLWKLTLLRPVRFLFRKQTICLLPGDIFVYEESGFLQLWWGNTWFQKFTSKDVPPKFNPGALDFFFFFLTDIWTERVVSWPDSSLKCQTFSKKTAVLCRKVFFIKVCHFSYWNGIFFLYIKTGQTFVLRGKTRSKTEGYAFHDFLRQSTQDWQTLAKS